MVKHAHGLRGLGVDGTRRAGPLLLQRTEQDVVPAVLDDLSTEAGRMRLAVTEARERMGEMERNFFRAQVEASSELGGLAVPGSSATSSNPR